MMNYRFEITDILGRILAMLFTECDDDDVAHARAAALIVEYGDGAHMSVWEGKRKVR